MTKTRRVLVIDDEEIVLLSVAKTLGREGYEVDKAFSAEEALEKLGSNTYDVIVTDLMMPQMNGIELLCVIKERDIATPAIMITGYPTIKTAIEALRLGAVDYVPKPFTRQELLSPVSRAVQGGADQGREAAERVSVYEEDMDQTTSINIGDEFVLRKHSWARYEEDDTLVVGIEETFLLNVGVEDVKDILLPEENELIEQGHSSLKIVTRSGNVHNVYMPLSGRVVATNAIAPEEIRRGKLEVWVIKMEPSKLRDEIGLLKKRVYR